MFGRVQHGHGHGGGAGSGSGNVCKFYQQGRCKFGDSCKFEHPGANRPQENQNRFQALGNQGNSYGQGNRNNQRPQGPARGQQYNSQNLFAVTRDGIEADLKNEKPTWPFSAYGPGKDAPTQLFGGFPLEQSPEEMRVLYYQAVASGNTQVAIQGEQDLIAQTNQQIQRALGDLDGAVKYILDAQNQHPNRIDMCQASNENVFQKGRRLNPQFSGPSANPAVNAPVQSSGFGQPSSLGNGGGGFGQPSALGGGNGSFGQPSSLGGGNGGFGQPSNLGGGGGFGQASALGQKPSPFGQPASGAPSAAGFGQASSLGQKPSPFGQPAGNTGGFGQPSALNAKPAWGQPTAPSGGSQASPFAQAAQPTQPQASPFTQTSQQGGGFGQPSALGQQQNGAFGQPSSIGQQTKPAFGQPSAPGPQNTPFGQPSALGQNTPFGQPSAPASAPSPFGRPSASASPFGQPSVPAPAQQQNALGNTSVFGKPSQPQASPFAQAPATSNPFGQSSQPVSNPAANPFGQATVPQQQAQSNGSSQANPAPQGEWITRHANNTVRTFKDAPVQYMPSSKEAGATSVPHYRKSDGSMERIWHPEGTPARKTEMEAPAEAYTAEIEAAYKFVAEQGMFKDGIMPEVPPKFDWIRWDV